MSEVPEVIVEHCNGVDTEGEAMDEANQNGDDGYVANNLIEAESSLKLGLLSGCFTNFS